MFESCTVLARMLSWEWGAARSRDGEREMEDETGDPLNLVCRSPALLPTDADSAPLCIDGLLLGRLLMARGGVVAGTPFSPSRAISIAVAEVCATPLTADAFGANPRES